MRRPEDKNSIAQLIDDEIRKVKNEDFEPEYIVIGPQSYLNLCNEFMIYSEIHDKSVEELKRIKPDKIEKFYGYKIVVLPGFHGVKAVTDSKVEALHRWQGKE